MINRPRSRVIGTFKRLSTMRVDSSMKRYFFLITASGIPLAGFYFLAYKHPELFSIDGARDYFFTIPHLFRDFKRLFLAFCGFFALAIACVLWNKSLVARHYRHVLIVLTGICALLVLGFTFIHYFQKDELEHVHSTWKMVGGARPFSDFFQHHHPLLWYQSMPVVKLFGASVSTLFALRFVQFLFLLGILRGTYQIARLVTGSWESGYIALLLLLTFKLFIETGLEVRPDVQQAFFCTYGFYYFSRFLQSGREVFLIMSGIAVALAFFYLQKALFFLLPLGLIFLYLMSSGRLHFRAVVVWGIAFLIPVAVFFLYYVLSGQWEEYVLFSWIVNFYKTPVENPWSYYSYMLIWNPVFLTLIFPGVLYLLTRYRHIPPDVKMTFFVGAVIFCVAFMNPRAWKQYYFPAFPFIAVYLGYMLRDFLAGMAEYKRVALYVILIFSAVPVFLIDWCYPAQNLTLFDAIRSQREHTSEYAFDEEIRQNLFQEDMHFFWFSTHQGRMYDAYKRAAGDAKNAWALKKRHDDFDLCRLIEQYRPLTVYQSSDSLSKIEQCENGREKYREIEPGIFKRNPD